MAEYYNCFLGEVMNAALPAPLKIDSETVLTLNKGFEYDEMELDDEAFLISEALSLQSELTWGDIESILQKSNVKKNVNELIEAGIVDEIGRASCREREYLWGVEVGSRKVRE